MSCWEILGVDVGADKKAIKSAYARLLKKSRPDEDPEGFKQLHHAYKEAISLSTRSDLKIVQDAFKPTSTANERTEEDLTQEPLENVQVEVEETLSDELSYLDEALLTQDDNESSGEEDNIADTLQQNWTLLFEQVDVLLERSPWDEVSQDWHFIDETPSIMDIEFKSKVSDHLFLVIARANQEASEQGRLAISAEDITYLSHFFDWETKWLNYSKQFDDALLEAVYPHIIQTEIDTRKPWEKLSKLIYFKRLVALTLDVLIPVMTFLVILDGFGVELDATQREGYIKQLLFVYFLVIVPLCEGSRWQASFGKQILGLYIALNKGNGHKLTLGRSFYRSFICILSLSICWISISFNALWWIITFLSAFIGYKYYGLLPHDMISLTYVAERNREETL